VDGGAGHLLGAAGAVEAIFTALAVSEGWAPGTVNLTDADPPGVLANLVAGGAQRLAPGPRVALTNSFGFGGTNACLVLCSPPGDLARRERCET
jgi:3-oxoacyl-[acyl-carrier-protein] synthase II